MDLRLCAWVYARRRCALSLVTVAARASVGSHADLVTADAAGAAYRCESRPLGFSDAERGLARSEWFYPVIAQVALLGSLGSRRPLPACLES
jgi:hypothetical protein